MLDTTRADIMTATGRYFDLLAPERSQFGIEDSSGLGSRYAEDDNMV